MLFKKIFPLIIVSFFAFVAGLPLLHEGLIPTHDGEYHVVRFFLFNESFLDGNLYPRWAAHLNNGFGVPLFNFVYPLPNYIAVFLHGFGVSFIDTFKFEMFVATLIGAVFFYLWGKEFWGKLGGVISSIFYTFSPYHFVDIYVRGSVGEVWALAFFPAFLWGFTRFVMTKQRIFLVFSSLLLVLTILSHNILALMFFIFSLLYIALLIYREKNKKYLILNTLCAILFSLGLSAIFWLPAIYETKYVTGLQIFDIASHFPSLYQLLIPSWGSGFRGTGLQNEMSYQIGAANLIAVFFSIVIIFFQIKRKSSKLPYTVFFLTCFIIVFFLMLSVSLPMWKIIPFMNYLQFPWRLLSLEILFASFLAGSFLSLNVRNKFINFSLAIFLIFMTFIMGIGYARPAYYMYRDDNYYMTRSNFMDGTNSPGNVFNTIWFDGALEKQKNKIIFKNNSGQVKTQLLTSTRYKFDIFLKESAEAVVNTAYFPGWEVFVDGKKIKIGYNNDGLITFPILQGKHSILVTFQDIGVRNLAKIVSSISLLWLIIREQYLFSGRFLTFFIKSKHEDRN